MTGTTEDQAKIDLVTRILTETPRERHRRLLAEYVGDQVDALIYAAAVASAAGSPLYFSVAATTSAPNDFGVVRINDLSI